MTNKNAEYQREYRQRMASKGWKLVQGIYAPNDPQLRRKIREQSTKLIQQYNERTNDSDHDD